VNAETIARHTDQIGDNPRNPPNPRPALLFGRGASEPQNKTKREADFADFADLRGSLFAADDSTRRAIADLCYTLGSARTR